MTTIEKVRAELTKHNNQPNKLASLPIATLPKRPLYLSGNKIRVAKTGRIIGLFYRTIAGYRVSLFTDLHPQGYGRHYKLYRYASPMDILSLVVEEVATVEDLKYSLLYNLFKKEGLI